MFCTFIIIINGGNWRHSRQNVQTIRIYMYIFFLCHVGVTYAARNGFIKHINVRQRSAV